MKREQVEVLLDIDAILSHEMMEIEARLGHDILVLSEVLETKAPSTLVDLEGVPLHRGRIIHHIAFELARRERPDLDIDSVTFLLADRPKANRAARRTKPKPKPADDK